MANLGILGDWISGRPKWQQEALKILVKQGNLKQEDKAWIYELCKGATDKPNEDDNTSEVPSVNAAQTVKYVKIHELSGLEGVGPISSTKPLTFSDEGLTVVYGRNGTGKTSYVRFLKSITGNRFATTLMGNVFLPTAIQKKAKVKFSVNDQNHVVDWEEKHGKIDPLSCVAIYDSHCASIYVSNENEMTFEPHVLKLLTDLAAVCTEFDGKISAESKALITKIPTVPPEYRDHSLVNWLLKLSKSTKEEEIEKNCAWSEADEATLKSVSERLAEANPAEKVRHLKKELEKIQALKNLMEETGKVYSDDLIGSFIIARKDAAQKREAADSFAKTCFEGAPLEGIGSDVWKSMWSAAKAFSEAIAYPEKTFPALENTDLCVLCLRPHDNSSIKYFKSFNDFVVGKLEHEAGAAEVLHKDLLGKFNVSSEAEIDQKLKDATLEDQKEAEEIKKFFVGIRERHSWLVKPLETKDLPQFPKSIDLSTKIKELASRIETLEKDTQADARAVLQNELKTLQVRKWLGSNLKNCQEEVKRLNLIAILDIARKSTATGPISTKKSALSETLLTEAFVKRFQEELDFLGGKNIQVELLKTRTDKSKVFHQIKLKGLQQKITAQVLSEGEQRIVSLAAFLADLLGQEQIGTFVFDDPISSLDQTYEKTTASRLSKLSEDRQVVVFTHRLSLAHALTEEGGSLISLRPGGSPEELPIQWEKKTDKVINRLLNERVKQARNFLQQNDTGAYEVFAKSICSDIRILVERMIELDLFGDIDLPVF